MADWSLSLITAADASSVDRTHELRESRDNRVAETSRHARRAAPDHANADQIDARDRRLAVHRDLRNLVQDVEAVDHAAEDGVFAVERWRVAETMKNDVVALAGSSPRAIDTMPFTCFVSLNSG